MKYYTRSTISLICFVFIIFGLVPVQHLQAQSTAEALLEEVVVTARKRNEALQDVPISVVALTDEVMKALNITQSEDIAFYTPNFTWNSEFGKTSPQVYLRGVGSNNFMPNNTGPVAVYQDNVYHGPNITHAFATFDLDRVEILKGPQGTLYGRNSTGGLINFHSRKPEVGGGFNGNFSAELGRFETTNFGGAIGFPIAEKWAGRVAFAVNKNSGIWENHNEINGEETSGKTEDTSARVQVLYEPTERLSVLFNAHGTVSTPDTEPYKSIGTVCPDGVEPGFDENTGSICPDMTGYRSAGGYYTTNTSVDIEELRTVGGFIQIDYDHGPFTVTSLSALDVADHKRFDDSDDTPLILQHYQHDDVVDYYSQELRVAGTWDDMNWTAGAYYYKEHYDGHVLGTSDDHPIFGAGGYGSDKTIDTESYAVFGDFDYQFTDKIGLNAGLRWTHESKEVPRYVLFLFDSTGRTGFIEEWSTLTGINTPTFLSEPDTEETFNKLTWRLAVDYAVNDDVLLFASYARGFKGGEVQGFGLPWQLGLNSRIIAPEELDAWEVGVKSSWLGNSLRFNSSFFYYEYEDQQVSTFISNPFTGGPASVIDNSGSSDILGVEAELTWALTEQFLLVGNFGYVDAKYDEFVSFSPLGDISGNRMAFTPETEGSLLASYEFPLANGGNLAIQGDMVYSGDIYFQPGNQPTLHEDSYTLFNAALKYTSPNDAFSVTVFGKNLTNKGYFSSGFDLSFAGLYCMKAGQPRYYGIKFDYNFDL